MKRYQLTVNIIIINPRVRRAKVATLGDSSERRKDQIEVRMEINVTLFHQILEHGTDAEQDVLYECIAAASPEHLAPFFFSQNYQLVQFPFTALISAVHLGNLRFMRLLVQKGAGHVVADGKIGTTTLMLVAPHTHILRYWLQKLNYAVIVNAQNHFGWTALHYTLSNPQSVELLLEHGADPNIATSMCSPLCCAARYGHTESAALLW